MTIRATIETTLADSGITAYWLIAPNLTDAPCVVYQQVSMLPMRTHNGNAATRQRWQLSCWAYTPLEAEQLAEQVKGIFDLNQTIFEFASVEMELDFPDAETELQRKILEFQIWKKDN